MKQIILMLVVVFGSNFAAAESARITKVKGQQAIVQFPPGSKPQVGQAVTVDEMNMGSSNEGSGQSTSGAAGSRDYTLGVSTSLSVKSDSQTSRSTTHFDVGGRFGWNMVNWEAGPILLLSYDSTESSSTTTFGAGGFGDYNFIPNVSGAEMVHGIGAEISYASETNSRSNISTSVLGLFLGGFIKYFALGNSVALRGDLGYDYDRSSQSNSSNTSSISGLLVKGGLQVYF